MKNKIAAFLLTALALVAPKAVRADLIWYEGFNYPNGSLAIVATNIWSVESGTANPDDMFVSNHIVQVSATGAGSISSRQDDLDRILTNINNTSYTNNPPQQVFASFTVICSNLPSGAGTFFASFYSTSSGYAGRVQALTNGTVVPGTWRIGISGNVSNSAGTDEVLGIDLATNTPYQVVAMLDPVTAQEAFVWVNPISQSDVSANSDKPDHLNFAITNAVNAFAFRQASGFNGLMLITNLATATTWIEAATNVWATNAVAPTIAYNPLGTTNFVGKPVSIAVVANGQGLAELNYQWFNGTNPVANDNGNSNVFTLNSPASTDSGQYSVVVTTPYGLSVTSAPVTVFVDPSLIPPIILSGPNSQSVFVGQDVTFGVNVSSPGNIFYQWRSNGVDIVGANNSSFSINDVQTSDSANYSCFVTNDVVTQGTLSSNAVLTVTAAQNISIALLRTFVDPNTFQPTNTPPTIPYTVTGVVTSFTNITSGNTSSYYLQDATAGINIFASFETSTATNTFRPQSGDMVSFTGVLSFFGGLELDAFTNADQLPQTTYAILSHNNPLPTPVTVPYNFTNNIAATNFNYSLAGLRVQITNALFGTNAGKTISTTANMTITVTNASGQKFSVEFFDLDPDTAGKIIPTNAFAIIGNLQGGGTTAPSLAVTRYADIVTNNPVISPIPLLLSTAGGKIVLSWSNPALVLQSSTNVNGPYTDVTGATSPFTNTVTTNENQFFQLGSH